MYQRIYSIDYMRIMLAAFVVIGHAGMGRETFGVYGLITLNTILRLAVPLFAMTAGFSFCARDNETSTGFGPGGWPCSMSSGT